MELLITREALQSKLKLGQNGLPQMVREGFLEEEVFKGAIGEAEEAATTEAYPVAGNPLCAQGASARACTQESGRQA